MLNDLVCGIITTSGKLMLKELKKLTIVKKHEEIIILTNDVVYQILKSNGLHSRTTRLF